MVNFSGILYHDIKGHTEGTAYLLSAFRKDFLSGEEKWAYIENIIKIPSKIFYTFVGGFVIEFGKIATACIAIVFFYLERQLIRKYSQDFGFLFVLCFFGYFYGYGVFLFILQKFMGAFNIIFSIMGFAFFINRK